MPLSDQTRKSIHNYLLTELTRYVGEAKSSVNNLEIKPFHARLLPSLFNVKLSERSFSTRSGSWWEIIARYIGRQFHAQAENAYRINGQIKPAAMDHIDEIIAQLNDPDIGRSPNRETDLSEVLIVQAPGGNNLTIRADLYIRKHDNTELYFEIKTPTPNKDTSMAMKKFILRVGAMRKGSPAHAYAATAYNPYGDGETYIWRYAPQFLEIGSDMLIGRDFWTLIGDEHTQDELFEIAEAVGKEITKLIANPENPD